MEKQLFQVYCIHFYLDFFVIVTCLLIVISFYFVFLIGVSAKVQALQYLYVGCQSRVNTIFIQDTYVSSYLVYGTEGEVRV
jgi:hypothetical protein